MCILTRIKYVLSFLILTISLAVFIDKTEVQSVDVTPVTNVTDFTVAAEEIVGIPLTVEALSDSVNNIKTEVNTKEDSINNETINNRWSISLTDDERDLLAQIVYLEAGNQGLVGQEYVVVTVFNRMADERFPSTLHDVLSQRKPVQFTSWKHRNKSQPTDVTYQAIDDVVNGVADDVITSSEFIYFSAETNNKNAIKIGDHWFWK